MKKPQLSRVLALTFALALSFCLSASAATITDGPYLDPAPKGQWRARWVEGDETALKVREQIVSVGQRITVPGVGALPAFQVKLRKPDKVAPDEVKLPRNRSLFVIADIHGEFEIFVELLRAQGIVDSALNWSYGRGYVAFLGDIFDRGSQQTEVLWLIYKLEEEAHHAGGRVLMTLGNHESMVLLGDRRYLADKYPKAAQALGEAHYSRLWDKNSFLGHWLRTKPVVMKIGEALCMHGGISPQLVEKDLVLKDINNSARDLLSFTPLPQDPNQKVSIKSLPTMAEKSDATEAQKARATFVVTSMAGPLWYRGYFPNGADGKESTAATDKDIDEALEHFDAGKILVGHTTVKTVTMLYDGKVIAVQVYPTRDKQTHQAIMEAAVMERGVWYRAKIDGGKEVLTPSREPPQ